MMIIRPIRQDDYAVLFKIAEESGHGFTSLPVNEELIQKKLSRSEASFKKAVSQPGDEGYLFVMEDSETGEVVGTSGIEAAVGLDDAFYHYHLGKVVHSSRSLNVYNTVETLTLCNDYTGATEICTLFLREAYRKDNNGKLLSKFRFLFLQEQQHRFSDTVIAEMRGVSDANGDSPFWQWLEEHFFSMDFPTADYLTGIGQKVFVAELMPKYPIYVNLLSKEAQDVIGHVHDNTRPAIQLLKSEGFNFAGYVDIFDGGPTVEANIKNIRSASQSKNYTIVIGESASDDAVSHLISNTEVEDFRATLTPLNVDVTSDSVTLSQKLADLLLVKAGDSVRLVAL
ncbi:arginine N-succinyltransferase [Flocculibacter collagenilyticus]|uniref:arginine N-succinyltransferase n=1 Tax=Flocculibacter collagenilyticus TaxID=2744479 RepID=UPI0018F41430|nr:arginine N-succinyltransferase [Flocculibacter collagenilyticus]